jgi:hypothetical protein
LGSDPSPTADLLPQGYASREAAGSHAVSPPPSSRRDVADDQLISEGRVVDDRVPRPGQRLSQPARVLPDRVGRQRLVRLVIEFGADPVVVDYVTSMFVEEGEEPPEFGRQATWLASDQHEVPSPVDVPDLVEIVGERDLLAASIAERQRLATTLSVMPSSKCRV